jgi:hypothetical protein
MRIIIICICSLFFCSAFAQVINYQTDSFSDIEARYKSLGGNPKTTLMVFDLDDTLITMSQPLGSVGWWDWQRELQKHDGTSDKLFTNDYQQLVRIQNILFQLIKMEVTDEYVLHLLKNAASQGTMLMGLTARGPEHLSATFMQLKDNQFMMDEESLFQKYGLKLNNKTSGSSTFHCPEFNREVLYQQGIIFLEGEDKGQALLCILTNTKQDIKTILFVDDAQKNTVSMAKAFANQGDFLVLNVLYTKEHAKEQEIQINPNLQAELLEQWNFLKKSLNQVIFKSNF